MVMAPRMCLYDDAWLNDLLWRAAELGSVKLLPGYAMSASFGSVPGKRDLVHGLAEKVI